MPIRNIKTKIESNLGAKYASRFFNTIWTYRLCQLTTSRMRSMKESSVLSDMGGSSDTNRSNSDDPSNQVVKSDLQPHGLYRFNGEEHHSLLVAVPKQSEHYRNILECERCSVMIGHTDPQLFHWFKELGTVPPRGIISGPVEVLRGDLQAEAWEEGFITHPVIHRVAQDMWESDASRSPEERVEIERREKEEDEKRMRRMSSSDWRGKFRDRERNPSQKEDEERPIYVVKPDTFVLLRVKPEGMIWMNSSGEVKRVWEPSFPSPPPLCRCSHRFINMLNLARQKLVPSLNMNYNLKLTNAFVCDLDEDGLWVMGTQENFSEKNGVVKEQWSEFRLDYGKSQKITTEQEMEWWIRGLTKLGAPEVSQSSSSIEDAGLNPEDYDYRHI